MGLPMGLQGRFLYTDRLFKMAVSKKIRIGIFYKNFSVFIVLISSLQTRQSGYLFDGDEGESIITFLSRRLPFFLKI
jgi:hypothetical protein